jgi:hypothetical protein
MKLSDGFDARRLRPKGQSNWRFRIGAAIAALLAMSGVLLAMAGIASLLGHAPGLGDLNTNRRRCGDDSGDWLVVLYLGVWLWRRSRRRSRQSRELNMSPHLMKKHD